MIIKVLSFRLFFVTNDIFFVYKMFYTAKYFTRIGLRDLFLHALNFEFKFIKTTTQASRVVEIKI